MQGGQTRGLRRNFGTFEAVRRIDLNVARSSFYGFLGPNGAGKSTTIKCLTGLLTPSAGQVHILGRSWDHAEAIKRRIRVVPEDLALFGRLTGMESLVFVGRVHALPATEIRRRSEQLLWKCCLSGLEKLSRARAFPTFPTPCY